MIRGVDDGPDGLREGVFDRAMSAPIGRKPKRARKRNHSTAIPPAEGQPHPWLLDSTGEISIPAEAGTLKAQLDWIAAMPCSNTDSDQCGPCHARRALIRSGNLGLDRFFRWIAEACRG